MAHFDLEGISDFLAECPMGHRKNGLPITLEGAHVVVSFFVRYLHYQILRPTAPCFVFLILFLLFSVAQEEKFSQLVYFHIAQILQTDPKRFVSPLEN